MTLTQFLYVFLTAFLGFIGYLVKNHMQRIENIESSVDTKITEAQTRQIMSDKLDPIKEGLDEVKEKINSLYDLLLK